MADTTTRVYELQVKLATDSLAQLKKLNDAAKKVEQSFDKMGERAKAFGAAMIAAFAARALSAFTASIGETIERIDEMGAASQRLGIAVETFSALQFAAEQSDLAVADLETGLKELQKSMAEGDTKGAKILDALSIDKTKPQVEVLKDFADKFADIKSESLKTSVLLEVFGKAGLKLKPLLDEGKAGIEDLMQAAADLGLVIGSNTAKEISELDNNLKKVKARSGVLSKEMVDGLSPALNDIAKAFLDSSKGGTAFEAIGAILGTTLRVLATTVMFTVTQFRNVGVAIYGVAAAAASLAQGNVTEAWGELASAGDRIAENNKGFNDAAATMWNFNDATNANAKAVKGQTEALGKLDGALKKIIAPPGKEQKAKETDFQKVTEALKEQIAQLERADSEFPIYEKALDSVLKVLGTFKEGETAAALALVERIRVLEETTIAQKAYDAALKDVEATIAAGRSERQVYTEQLAKIRNQMVMFPQFAEQLQRAEDKLTKEFGESQTKRQGDIKDTGNLYEALADKVDGYSKSISDSLVDFATNSGDAKTSFSDFVNSVLRDLAKMTTQMLLVEPIVKAFKGWLTEKGRAETPSGGGTGTGSSWVDVAGSFIKKLFTNAEGNMIASPSLSRYSGKVYDSPKMFAFAKGAGVFAEAGPEAIMPLKRGADGSLGVDTSGAGGDVTVNVYNEARAEVQTKTRTDANGQRMIEVFVKDAVTSGFKSGAFDGIMGATYGLNRMGAR